MIQNIYQELLHLKVTRNGRRLAYIKGFPPFRGKFEGLLTLNVCNALPWFLYDFLLAYNELSKCETRFLE